MADGSGEKALIGGKGVGYEKRGEKSRKEEAGETETVRPKCDQRPIWSGTRASLLREQPDREATRNARGGIDAMENERRHVEKRCRSKGMIIERGRCCIERR